MYESTIESARELFSSYNLDNTTSNGMINTKEYRLRILHGQQHSQDKESPSAHETRSLHTSYTWNTERENTCNQKLNSILLHLKSKWERHMPWFVVAPNEFNVPKCICASIQPTPYPRYCINAESCAKELALHMQYEPFNLPKDDTDDDDTKINLDKNSHDSSRIVISPTQTLEWGIGDCFDLSTLLVSFLLGMGYDAYVVHGAAPKWIRTMDESKVDRFSSFRNSGPIHQTNAVQELTRWIELTRSMKTVSKSTQYHCKSENFRHPLQRLLEQGLEQDVCDFNSFDENSIISDDDECNFKDLSEHCWIFIRNDTRSHISTVNNQNDTREKSQKSQFYFLEPSTGQRFNLDVCCPYKEVYAMWNAKNYWILTPTESLQPITHSLLTFPDALWIPLFINPMANVDGGISYEPSSPCDARHQDEPPLSWVRELHLIAAAKLSRYPTYPPTGQRTFMISDGRVDLFAKGMHSQGLEKRVTKYMNASQHRVQEIFEYFWPDGRSDNMQWRIRLPDHMAIHEKYFSSNPIGLEDWYEILGHRRMIRFRPFSRIDGLLERDEMYGVYICDTFQNRVDGITKREVHFKEDGSYQKGEQESIELTSMDSGPLSRSVESIILRYSWDNHRNIKLQTDEKTIAKRTFLLDEKRVLTEFFNEDGSLNRNVASDSYTTSRRSILQNYNSDERSVNKDLSAQVNSILTSMRSLHYEMQEILQSRERI